MLLNRDLWALAMFTSITHGQSLGQALLLVLPCLPHPVKEYPQQNQTSAPTGNMQFTGFRVKFSSFIAHVAVLQSHSMQLHPHVLL